MDHVPDPGPAGRAVPRATATVARTLARTLAVLALVAAATASCSSSPSGGSTSAAAGGSRDALDSVAAPAPGSVGRAAEQGTGGSQALGRAVVSTGQVELSSTDVAAARADVGAVLAHEEGRIADESTTTDEGGTVTRTHLVLRVPSARFDDAMRRLAGVATLRSSSRKAEDVTTQVIDLRARITAQRAGVRRLRQLVAQTGDLRALLAVERELSARQGDLESLRRQQAYLADQTTLATITVDVSRTVQPATPAEATAGGFVGGLTHGWHALVATGTGVLLVVGLLLPFASVGALLGIPAWLVVRRVRRAPVEPEEPVEA